MEINLKTIKDIYGNEIFLEKEPLGKGGQGFVFKTKDQNIAVKLLQKNGSIIEDMELSKKYAEIIEDSLTLNLPKGINVCKPETIIKEPYCGYTMKLLNSDRLSPISKIFGFNDYKELNKHYSLKKRLELLIELSRTLSVLHSQGFVYCDLSPNNVLADIEDENYSKVWLIDCDNIRKSCDVNTSIFTPGYGAPEIVSGSCHNNMYSDIYSFAVLAFKMLMGIDPMFVNYSDGSTSGGWDDSSSQADKNPDLEILDSTYVGSPDFEAFEDVELRMSTCMSKYLKELFENVFSMKSESIHRPLMNTWYKTLIKEYEYLIKCPFCGNFTLVNGKKCLLCDNDLNFTPNNIYKLKIQQGYSELYVKDVLSALNGEEDFSIFKNENNEKLSADELVKYLVRESFKDYSDIVLYDGKIVYSFETDIDSIENEPEPLLKIEISADESIIIRKVGEINLVRNDKETKKLVPVEYIKVKSLTCFENQDFNKKCLIKRFKFESKK